MTGRCFLLALGLLAGCAESDAPDEDLQAIHPPEIVRITPAAEALAGAHVPTLDPSTMNDAEIGKALAAGPRCDFRYTASGRPVLAVRMRPDGRALAGLVKLNGHLVPLEAAPVDPAAGPADKLLMLSEPVRIELLPDPQDAATAQRRVQRREANMIFEVGKKLRAGYRGYLDCPLEPHRQARGG